MSLVPCTWYWYCGQAPPVCVCIWDCIAICADICRNQLKAAPPLCFICPKQSPQMRRWTSTSSGFGFVKRVQGFKLVSKSTPSQNGLSVYKSNSFYGIIGWYLFAFLSVTNYVHLLVIINRGQGEVDFALSQTLGINIDDHWSSWEGWWSSGVLRRKRLTRLSKGCQHQ